MADRPVLPPDLASGGAIPLGENYDLIVLSLGEEGAMDEAALDEALAAFKLACRFYPAARFQFVLGTYDDDPRSLWDIPEAAARVRRFAAQAFAGGFDPLLLRCEPESIALLVKCGSFGDAHPFVVVIREDDPS